MKSCFWVSIVNLSSAELAQREVKVNYRVNSYHIYILGSVSIMRSQLKSVRATKMMRHYQYGQNSVVRSMLKILTCHAE